MSNDFVKMRLVYRDGGHTVERDEYVRASEVWAASQAVGFKDLTEVRLKHGGRIMAVGSVDDIVRQIALVPDEQPEETAVREGDLYEVVSMSLKEYAILELRNLADLIEAGDVRLLDMGISSPDISEAIEDGYVVASAGNRWVMNISYWMKRE